MDEQTRRLEHASDWLVRLQEGSSEEEIVRWVEWCEADPENRKAFERLLPLWQASELVGVETLQAAASNDRARPGLRLTWLRSQPWLSLAAVLLLMIGLGSLWWIDQPKRLQPSDNLRSLVARNQAAMLPDGSGLELGAGSSVVIDFHKTQRNVELDAGEAFFTVEHDASRPFVVHAGALQVRAVGTAFDVLRTGDRVAVTVQEGLVEVTTEQRDGDDAPQVVRAPAGYQVVYDAAHASKATMRMVDPVMATAWKRGRLEYIEEPLSSVIANLNRYSRARVVLRGAEAATLSYTGTIEVSSIDEWLQALPRIFPVNVATGVEGETVITTNAPAAVSPAPPHAL